MKIKLSSRAPSPSGDFAVRPRPDAPAKAGDRAIGAVEASENFIFIPVLRLLFSLLFFSCHFLSPMLNLLYPQINCQT